jgi:hypothetical protein
MKYFFAFLACTGLVILVLVLILKSLTGSSPKNVTTLDSYSSSNAVVQMTVDGPVVGDQQHQSYRITVSNNEAIIQTLQGYEDSAIATMTYPNNQASYRSFLSSLDLAGFTKGSKVVNNQVNGEEELGDCASGDRYTFSMTNNSSQIESYWTTSCGGQGTFKGETAEVKQLFNLQIPPADLSQLISPLNL